MHHYETIHRVGHKARDMFDLVADIEQYPHFLPLCEELRVVRRETREDLKVMIARMTVGYKLIRESFTTEVRLDPEHRVILVDYLDGPFSFLENRWSFEAAGEDACDVHFDIRYAFRSRMFEKLMGGLFAKAVARYSKAFEARADQIYGPPQFPAQTLA